MKLTRFTGLPESLARLLREARDDGIAPLQIHYHSPCLMIFRSDGSELSATEQREIGALLAADNAEPFK